MPIFSLGKSWLPCRCCTMLRMPLWPPCPPLARSLTFPVGKSKSSWTTRTCCEGICKTCINWSSAAKGTALVVEYARDLVLQHYLQRQKQVFCQTRTDLVVSSELANSLTTDVHEGDGLCQYDLMPCHSSTCLECLVLSFVERHTESSGKGVQDLEPNLWVH